MELHNEVSLQILENLNPWDLNSYQFNFREDVHSFKNVNKEVP